MENFSPNLIDAFRAGLRVPTEQEIAGKLRSHPQEVAGIEKLAGVTGIAACAGVIHREMMKRAMASHRAAPALALAATATAPTRPAAARPPRPAPARSITETILDTFNRLTGGEASAFYSANRKAIRQAQADAAKPKFS